MALWSDLLFRFEDAVDDNENDLVRRILMYAAWSISEKSGRLPNDTSSAAWVAFYEHLPTHKKYWSQFREWFYPHEFENIFPAFKYFLSDDELEELKATYSRGNK